MVNWIGVVALVAAISGAIYAAIALVMIVGDHPSVPASGDDAIDFAAAVSADYSDMPEPRPFVARDNTPLSYRLYGDPEPAGRIVVLLHGSGWHGMQFHAMARHIAEHTASLVAVPDLRGHGATPPRRGDIDYIGQFEDDVVDLLDVLQAMAPGRPVILGGHSSGGGLAIRFAGGRHGGRADGFLLLAPYLKYDAPTTRPNSGGWAFPATRRIIGLSMLNAVGVTALNHLPVIAFAMPRAVLDGPYGRSATTQYSFRLNTSFAPRLDYAKDLSAMTQPFLLVAGTDDEAFDAGLYQAVISRWTRSGTYDIVSGANHIGLLTDLRVLDRVATWIESTQMGAGAQP